MREARALLLLLLGACSSERAPFAEAPAPSEQDAGVDAQTSPPEVRSPAEALDEDPSPDVVHVTLHAARSQVHVEGRVFDGYAFNGQVPGPTLRAKVGDTLQVELINELDEATTLHWHGVSVPVAMDGVTWAQDPVPAHSKFTYAFTLTHPGTFWYHPHLDSHRQVDLGLYGALIVEDPAEPRADAEMVLVFDAWDESGGAIEAPHGDMHAHAQTPVLWTVNGVVGGAVEAAGGQTVRARLINSSIGGYLSLSWPGLRQIGGDQGLLSAPMTPERLLLAPGARAEVEWLIGEQPFAVVNHPYSLSGGPTEQAPQTLFEVIPDDPRPAPSPIAWPFDGLRAHDDPGYMDILYVFSGSQETGNWMINGEVFPDVTIEEIPLGETAIIELRNLSDTEHPFHLHGMPFEVLSIDGVAPLYRTIEDTINVRIRQRVRLRLEANNPGDWMAHCHILPHAHQGMMTVLRVQ